MKLNFKKNNNKRNEMSELNGSHTFVHHLFPLRNLVKTASLFPLPYPFLLSPLLFPLFQVRQLKKKNTPSIFFLIINYYLTLKKLLFSSPLPSPPLPLAILLPQSSTPSLQLKKKNCYSLLTLKYS